MANPGIDGVGPTFTVGRRSGRQCRSPVLGSGAQRIVMTTVGDVAGCFALFWVWRTIAVLFNVTVEIGIHGPPAGITP